MATSLLTWVIGRKRSLGYAIQGLTTLYRETNARIHAVATALVIALGVALGLSSLEWTLLAIAAPVVWVAEALNTALEALSDATVPEPNPHIAVAKDVAAGAVLLASVGALAVGLLVFVPHLAARFGFST
ncbi:MAG TPA: diacylglycerol kinase family protein [Polyangiaceae bacterium]|jgi:diacylglycerol kinase (ATP)|nr:diacylglycerol kinase family protein [Polyangiaceae bacterium]